MVAGRFFVPMGRKIFFAMNQRQPPFVIMIRTGNDAPVDKEVAICEIRHLYDSIAYITLNGNFSDRG